MLGLAFLIFLLFLQIIAVLGMILILVSSVSSSLHGAPFVPIKKKLVEDILKFGGLSSDDTFFDLGSGDGRVLISAVEDLSVVKAVGYEISFWPFLVAKWKIRRVRLGDKIQIYRKSFFDAKLAEASFVYVYLFPKLVDRLAEKIARECRSGTKILCPSFPIDLAKHPEFRLLKTEKNDNIIAYLYEKI